MAKEKKKLFQRKDKQDGIWYLYLHDPITGKFIRKSSGTQDEAEALRIWDSEQEYLNTRTSAATLGSLLASYTDAATNPRRKQALMDGTPYSDEYAYKIAVQAEWMLHLFKEKTPKILNMHIAEIRAIHIKTLKEAIIEKRGQCRSSQFYFRTLKTVFSQAHEDGLIEYNPSIGLKDIAYSEKKRSAVDESIIRKIIDAKNSFISTEDWAYFTVLATTGMRRSEALALTERQIKNGILTIDSAVKSDTSKDVVGLPKWGLIRVIPLPRITQYALSLLKPDMDGRYFPYKRPWATYCFARLTGIACALFPEDKEEISTITPHILRHSLNTNLLANEVSPVLVAYYLSWQHQALLDMQERYTHLQAKKLIAVSDSIDRMFPINEKWLPKTSIK